jgi:hypothetical protein
VLIGSHFLILACFFDLNFSSKCWWIGKMILGSISGVEVGIFLFNSLSSEIP